MKSAIYVMSQALFACLAFPGKYGESLASNTKKGIPLPTKVVTDNKSTVIDHINKGFGLCHTITDIKFAN